MLGTILHSHYQIVKVLGTGKSGTTYLAQDLDSIESAFYVVKKIQYSNPYALTPSLVEKIFEIQAAIAYHVGQHPQVPSLVAKFVEDDDLYLVREYIDGDFLSQELIPGSTWSQTQVFDFLMDLIGILCFVHSFNYIHQDINPDNIIRRSDDGRFNLIGFSYVKDLASTWQNMPNHDVSNINDPSYTPYEQELNIPHLNSDIYAVGAIAIQAITGKFPIEKDAYSYELKWQDDVDPNIDRALIKIINKMVRPDYRNRYLSALEVLQDLQSFALTQIPADKSDRFKPYLIFGSAACLLLLGFGAVKLFSASANKPQLPPKIVAAVSPVAETTSSKVIWKKYVDRSAGIGVKYAANWHQEDIRNIVTGENVIFTSPEQRSPGKYRENISIRVETLTNAQTTLANYTQSTIAEISRYYQDAKIIESSSIILAKKPANLIVYTGKDENSQLVKNLEVWTIDRGKAYILTYKAAPDRYYQFLETAMATINSFELN
jgi:eukaryotic-like serine/threonine-protein kinase